MSFESEQKMKHCDHADANLKVRRASMNRIPGVKPPPWQLHCTACGAIWYCDPVGENRRVS